MTEYQLSPGSTGLWYWTQHRVLDHLQLCQDGETVVLDSRLASSWAVPLVDELCSKIGCWIEFTHLCSGRKWTKGAASKMKASIRQLLLTTEVGFVKNGEIREGIQSCSRACSVLCWLAETCGFLFPLMLRLGLVPMLTLQSYTGPGDSREKNTSGCFP